jgi:hypothetical protein
MASGTFRELIMRSALYYPDTHIRSSSAGIDLRRTPAGEWFCFEVNPSPAFSWFDAPDNRIAKQIAALLAGASQPERK